MSKTSFVLQALKLLVPEEILKLSEVLNERIPLKKAAGEELIFWEDDLPATQTARTQQTEATVLEFPKKSILDLAPEIEEDVEGEEDKSNLLSSELILWQREIARSAGDNIHKKDAFKGYKKSTEMYVVKSSDKEGKDKIRFASTNGILVNKKQA